jgi:hypothetical protein
MKRRFLVILAMIGVLCWAGMVSADTTVNYTLSLGNAAIHNQTGPYATASVTVDGSGTAHFTFTSVGNFRLMDRIGLNLNVTNTTGIGVANVAFTNPNSVNTAYVPPPGSGNISEFGTYNFVVKFFDGGATRFQGVSFDLTGVTFANAASVLALNLNGFPLVAGIWTPVVGNDGSNITGFASVPVPPTALLMGSGLLGLGLLGWRRRRG